MTSATILLHPKERARRRAIALAPEPHNDRVRCRDCVQCLAPPDALGVMACCALDGLPRITNLERECVEFERVG